MLFNPYKFKEPILNAKLTNKGRRKMKDKINAKGILSALIIILVLCLGTNIYGASVKEEQVVNVQKSVLHNAPKGDSQTGEQPKLDIEIGRAHV